MTVALTGSGGFFTIAGKAIFAIETKLTAQATTVPAEITDLLTAWEALPDDAKYTALLRSIPDAVASERGDTRIPNAVAQAIRDLLVLMVTEDTAISSNTLQTAVLELLSQMEAASASVDASTVSVTITPGGSNTGDAVLIGSVKSADGRSCEHALAETIAVDVLGTLLRLTGKAAQSDPLASDWPKGSGTSRNLVGVLPESSLTPAGTFDTDDEETGRPDGCTIEVGVPNSTLKLTAVEIQTVAISGTPTSGFYTLTYTNADGDELTTEPLAYNASGDDVEDALQALDGLESVEVVTTGLSPNFTHTITFVGVAGNVATLASSNTFDAGSIAHNTTTAGSAHAYRGRALEFNSDGSELTEIRLRPTLARSTVYAFHVRGKVDTFPAAGVMEVELIDGAGNVLDDDAGTPNAITIDPKSGGDLLTSAFSSVSGFFRTPALLPPVVYLRLRISTAISNTSSVFFDDLALAEASQFYGGGPFFQAFGTPDSEDEWSAIVANNRAGKFQEWLYRLGVTNRGQLAPSKTDGTETIADSLIA
jgi:hypothetical protein